MMRTSLVGLALLCLAQSCAASPVFTPQNTDLQINEKITKISNTTFTPQPVQAGPEIAKIAPPAFVPQSTSIPSQEEVNKLISPAIIGTGTVLPNTEIARVAAACPLVVAPADLTQTVEAVKKSYKCLDGKELNAIKLEKGTKFKVRSLEPMDSETPLGAIIEFESQTPQALIPDQEPANVIFKGEVVENNPPRFAGRSGTIKLEIKHIKVNNITYPAMAYVSKVGNRRAMGGFVAGIPNYKNNLSDLANQGTITIDKVYKHPCDYDCTTTTSIVKPAYYLGSALLQLADLMAVPIICLFKNGNNLSIPAQTAFEIKLDENISLLQL